MKGTVTSPTYMPAVSRTITSEGGSTSAPSSLNFKSPQTIRCRERGDACYYGRAAAIVIGAMAVTSKGAQASRKGFETRRPQRTCLSAGKSDADEQDMLILAVAEEAAKVAGSIIVEKVGADVIETKAFAADLLTEVDKQCEDAISRIVQDRFPEHSFLGEESAGDGMDAMLSSDDWLWIVDPIDGTTNFAAGQPLSAVSIGVAKGGKLKVGVIYEPFRKELFSAVDGQGSFLNGMPIHVSKTKSLADAVIASGAPPNPRSAAPCFRAMTCLAPPRSRTVRILGSAAINFAWVACGRLDAWFEPDLNAWDSAAGVLLVQEAGGSVTDCVGGAYTLSTRPICASNGNVHQELLKVLAEADATSLDDA
mmetsp:Transcript_46385/g.110475  ORF Transcript_46385/g.110475 Transcript_46385/m.110475 type:complete len:366 (+) Transcript_46385:182-1279(+)